jgi:hypothetical protein
VSTFVETKSPGDDQLEGDSVKDSDVLLYIRHRHEAVHLMIVHRAYCCSSELVIGDGDNRHRLPADHSSHDILTNTFILLPTIECEATHDFSLATSISLGALSVVGVSY